MSKLSAVTNTIDTMVGFANTYEHALAHKGLLTTGINAAVHDLTQHADELVGVRPLMSAAAAEDLTHAMGFVEGLRGGYSTGSYRYDYAKSLRETLRHALSHLQ